jgi:hypothetical protein
MNVLQHLVIGRDDRIEHAWKVSLAVLEQRDVVAGHPVRVHGCSDSAVSLRFTSSPDRWRNLLPLNHQRRMQTVITSRSFFCHQQFYRHIYRQSQLMPQNSIQHLSTLSKTIDDRSQVTFRDLSRSIDWRDRRQRHQRNYLMAKKARKRLGIK